MTRSGSRRSHLDLHAVAAGATAVALFDVVGLHVPFVEILLLGLFPGYAAVAVLYPRSSAGVTSQGSTGATSREQPRGRRPLDWGERLLASIVASILVASAVTAGVVFGPLPLNSTVLVVALGGGTLLLAAIAAVRRRRIDAGAVPDLRRGVGALGSQLGEEFRSNDSSVVRLNVAIVLAVLLTVAGLGLAIQHQPPTADATEYGLLTENETGGMTAADYPSNLTVGEPATISVSITNHEGRTTNYTTVVLLERVTRGNGSTAVAERVELDRFSVRVPDDERRVLEHEFAPSMTGEDLRLTYLFYTGAVPAEPTRETADDSLQHWLTVTDE